MASPRANHIIDIIGSSIPATEGTVDYKAFLKLLECHGKSYQTFRDLAGGPKGTPGRHFSPSKIIRQAEAANLAQLIPPNLTTSSASSQSQKRSSGDVSSRWSDEELTDTLSAYIETLSFELAGETTNKAEVNRRLRAGSLNNRSAGSIEYRMQNISAFLLSKGKPIIAGYKPADHIGSNTKARLDAIWQHLPEIEVYAPTCNEEELNLRARKLITTKRMSMPVGVIQPKTSQGTTKAFYRSPAVVAYVLQEANGRCEACLSPAPFFCDDGSQFLEVHHVTPLSAGGPDTVDNAVAVCPNCHRAFHYSSDRHDRTSAILENIARLYDYRKIKQNGNHEDLHT